MIVETARDRIFKRALYLGAMMGILIAGLNGLVIANEWTGLEHCFQTLDWPVFTLLALAQDWFPFLNSVSKDWYSEFLMWFFIVEVGYWILVGMSLMALLCVVRALVKRRSGKVEESG